DDYAQLRQAFDRTGFAALLKEPEFKEWIRSIGAEQQASLRKSIEELGIEPDEFPEPEGMIGAALWFDTTAASPMILHHMVAVEMGDNADDFDDLIESLLRRGEDSDQIRVLSDE